jgi:hypothetical protein
MGKKAKETTLKSFLFPTTTDDGIVTRNTMGKMKTHLPIPANKMTEEAWSHE